MSSGLGGDPARAGVHRRLPAHPEPGPGLGADQDAGGLGVPPAGRDEGGGVTMDPAALRMVRVRPMTLAQRQRLAEVTERARETWHAHLLAKKDKEALLREL